MIQILRSKAVISLLLSLIPIFASARKLSPEFEHALGHGAEARICLKVCDDKCMPVSNASVRAIFDMLPVPHSVYGKTDANGICVVEGKTNGNKVELFVGKDGYYGSQREMSYAQIGGEHMVKDGCWQPYGETVPICLRGIKNPQRLDSVSARGYRFTDAIGEWIGYDLRLNDYVNPYGEGAVSDFEVYLDWDRVYSLDSQKIGFKIRFLEPMSGYYSMPIDETSDFKTPYTADTNATFQRDAMFYDRYDGKRLGNTFKRSQCWVIRSRCKINRNGQLEEANYSVVRFLGVSGRSDLKAGFCFIGAFNPTPNDVNLEDEEAAKRARAFALQCEPPKSSDVARDIL